MPWLRFERDWNVRTSKQSATKYSAGKRYLVKEEHAKKAIAAGVAVPADSPPTGSPSAAAVRRPARRGE